VLLPGAALAAPGAPPRPTDDLISTTEGVQAFGNVLDNDTNLGDGSLSVTAYPALSTSIGTLTIDPDGAYTFTPAPDWFGTTTTTYDVTNDKHTRIGNITITVSNVQDPPTANDDTVTVDEDVPTDVTGQLLGNDTDPDSDTLAVTSIDNVTGGSADLTGGVVTFTGDADDCGAGLGSFDYTMSDGNGGSDSAHADVDVTCVNDNPTAVDDDATGTEDEDVTITAADLAADDTDVEPDSLTVTGVLNPNGGTVALDSGTITFTPDANLCGENAATFDYTVEDGNGGSDTGTVTIDLTCVNEQPVAGDDSLNGTEDTAVTATEGDLTANDTDVDLDPLSVTGVSAPTGGTVALESGVVTFTPDANACDPTEFGFDYAIADGLGGTDSAHVDVSIACANDNPATTDDDASGTEDQPVTITAADLAADDTDVEGGSLTVSGVTDPTGGTVSLDSGTITFTPDTDLCGDNVAGFDYTVEDGDGGSATGHVTIDLTCANDDPVAGDDDATVTEDTATDVTGGLLGDDTDVDESDTLSIASVSGASGGTVQLVAGVVTFTPAANLCGDNAGSFDYEVSDGTSTDTGTVTVDITCVNDLPVASDDDGAGTEDTTVTIAAADLATDDTDADLDTLAVSGVSSPVGGTVSLDAGTITFVPTANLCGDNAGSFVYTVEDGKGGSDTGTVTIDLTCVNDAPVAGDDTATVLGNSVAADHDVLVNDSDVDGGTPTIVSATVDAAAGTASVVAGKVHYAPKTGFTGQAVITYVITDGTATDSATLTITVGGDVTGPVVKAATVAFGSGRVDQTAPLRISWSATDVPSGVASYQVQVSIAGGAFKAVYAGTATSITKFYPFKQTLVFRVRAKDTVGNWSGWVTSGTRKIVSYQNTSTKVAYAGTWRQVSSIMSSGKGYAYTTQKGARVRLTFSGRSVLYVAPKTPSSGKVKVYVDGVLVGRFDLYRSSTRLGQIISRASWSAKGTHTIRVVADSGSSKRESFDAFIVLK
jgi:hypothetical protein